METHQGVQTAAGMAMRAIRWWWCKVATASTSHSPQPTAQCDENGPATAWHARVATTPARRGQWRYRCREQRPSPEPGNQSGPPGERRRRQTTYPIGGVLCVVRALCPHYARAVHKVCTVPYPICIVVPSINNNEPREYRVWSPSTPPSPSQPGRSLLASLEVKRRNTPPSRRSNTPSSSVSQPHAASQPARSPSASTTSSPSLPAQRTSHSW